MSKLVRLALWCVVPLAAQHESPADLGGAEAGSRTFRHNCSGCHGRSAQGGSAPDLTRGGLSDSDLARTISQGVTGTDMTAYKERLSPADIARVVAFIRSASRDEAQIKGDPARGEALFWGKAGCGNCHAAGTRGTRIGPDLTRIGVMRSIPYLREALLAPGSAVTPSLEYLTVTTREGRTVRGIQRELSDFTVILIDTTGAIHSFDRAGLRSVQPDPNAHAFGSTRSAAEINDLLAYLWTLRPAEETK
jgi:cytochrome c oxidase cbb3-type subunit 3